MFLTILNQLMTTPDILISVLDWARSSLYRIIARVCTPMLHS